jgi:glutamate/tyrosine decarboxylase-like PLP-dependent enzyme
MRFATPATAAVEQAAGEWIVDLLGLPPGSDVGFTTGATIANMSGLAAGRWRVLNDAGWDVNTEGLSGAPRLRLIAGEDRHASLDMAARYLGLGRPELVPCDAQGRLEARGLKEALARGSDPAIVCLQAGNLHSGAFDPFAEAVAMTREHGGWVHVDGAFGLWAAAVPRLRHLVEGVAEADSWATDAHKTLNVGYDCGVVVSRDHEALRSALGVQAAYLLNREARGLGDPMDKVPEMSRRARGVPVWAALRSLGRRGTVDMIDSRAATAGRLGERLAALPDVEILNDVVYTQLALAFGSDERTRAVSEYVMADDRAWMSGSRWRGRDVLRVSVTNWTTDDRDLDVVVEVLHDALAATA